MNESLERYIVRESTSWRYPGWEVAHYWADGCTVQTKYFKTKAEAMTYWAEKVGLIGGQK